MDLDRLLNPRTIAFVGGRHAELAIAQCDALGYEGEIWPVHPTRETVTGRPAVRSVADLPGPPDAAFVAVNRYETVEVVTELAKLGAGGAVCYASGFAEAGPEGQALQQQLVDHDMPVIGPNCYGTINTTSGAALWPDVQGCRRLEGRRGAALVTQSGNIALNLTMNTRGLDFTHVISLGNQAGVRIEDCIAALAADPTVAAIGVHAEAIIDSIAFADAALKAHTNQTPIVMLKTGVSEASAAIAASHTAAIAKPADVYQALFDRYSIITVDSVNQLAATLSFLVTVGPLPGNRLVSLSCSGGEASLLADRAAHHDVVFEPFAPEEARDIDAALDGKVAVTNPLDYHTFIWDDGSKLTACFTAALADTADAGLLVLDWPTSGDDRSWFPTLEAIIAAQKTTGTPTVVAASLAENMPAAVRDRLHEAGIAAAYSVDEALAAVAGAARAGQHLERPPPEIHTTPLPGMRVSRVLSEGTAKTMLAEAGIAVPRGHRGRIDALSAVDLRFPIVAKASGVAHKTDVGGVIVGIADSVALQEAVDRLAVLSDEVLIEEQITDAVAELLVTVRREPPIGNVLVLGSGGALVELLGDTVTAILPLSAVDVAAMIERLRIGPMVAGHRGRPAADIGAIVDVVARLAKLPADRPQIVEIEINPLMATPQSAVAVDALITLATEEASHD